MFCPLHAVVVLPSIHSFLITLHRLVIITPTVLICHTRLPVFSPPPLEYSHFLCWSIGAEETSRAHHHQHDQLQAVPSLPQQ